MSARGIIGGLAGAAVSAVKHPKETTSQALLAAKEMATTGTIVADRLLKRGREGASETDGAVSGVPPQAKESVAKAAAATADTVEQAAEKVESAAEQVEDKARETAGRATDAADAAAEERAAAASSEKKGAAKKPAEKKPAKKAAASKSASSSTDKPAKKSEPNVVLAVDLATPPEEPPVDVVGEALAKEAEEDAAPSGSSLPPVRDQDEAGIDPATVKAVRSESEMLRKAASPRKS